MKKAVALCLSVLILTLLLVGCNENNMETVSEKEETTVDTDAQSMSGEQQELELSINGFDISEYRIVYATSFNREQCYEDMSVAAKSLSEIIEGITGNKLTYVPDTEKTADKEIILGISSRAECIRYYNNSTRLEKDEYCVMYSNGKILLGADCLAGVMDACDVFEAHLNGVLSSGKSELNITDGFDISDKKHVPRIVCVGDSITQGVGADDEIKQSYPALLQDKLGGRYDVMNFGKGGATMCAYANDQYANRAYIEKSGYYDDLLAVAPYTDIVLIMLGSNDAAGSPEVTQTLKDDYNTFKTDYTVHLTKMVKELKAANANINIMVFSTTRAYSSASRESNLATYVRPLQKELCTTLKLDFYDMYDFSSTKMSVSDFKDGLHPNNLGYEKMSNEIAIILKKQYNLK